MATGDWVVIIPLDSYHDALQAPWQLVCESKAGEQVHLQVRLMAHGHVYAALDLEEFKSRITFLLGEIERRQAEQAHDDGEGEGA